MGQATHALRVLWGILRILFHKLWVVCRENKYGEELKLPGIFTQNWFN